jgi:hypothetical protein
MLITGEGGGGGGSGDGVVSEGFLFHMRGNCFTMCAWMYLSLSVASFFFFVLLLLLLLLLLLGDDAGASFPLFPFSPSFLLIIARKRSVFQG